MKVMRAPWRLKDGSVIDLITPAELKTLPTGTMLRCIDGESVVVGDGRVIDDDTRMGMLAYGRPRPDNPSDLGAYEIELSDVE